MEMPKQEKSIDQMSIAELGVAIEQAQQNLDGLFLEVRNNPNPASREEASEKIYAQTAALISMTTRQGELTRLAIDRMSQGGAERDIDFDPENNIPAFLRTEK